MLLSCIAAILFGRVVIAFDSVDIVMIGHQSQWLGSFIKFRESIICVTPIQLQLSYPNFIILTFS
jgi:hypothetical protein